MVTPVWLALPIIAIVAACAWLAIWSRRDTWARPAAVALLIVAIPVIGGALAETLGRAKPMAIAWEIDPEREYLALGARLVQDVGIWIWLDTGEPEPRSYRIPWSNEAAQAIQEAMDGAPEGREGEFLMRLDPEAEQTEQQFHALPQPATPPAKDTPDEGMVYQQE